MLEGFHRLTQELGAYGIAAAVASPYCLNPVSAASWMEAFYAELAVGRSVIGAAREARRKAQRDGLRAVAFEPVERPDWCEPVVFESAEFTPLLPMSANRDGEAAGRRRPPVLDSLPPIPATQNLIPRADL